jgi:ABC-2 type transport system permease protein
MRNALAIARKELGIYFSTPWAYVVFTAMLGISSFFFVNLLATFKEVQGSPGCTAGPGCRPSTGSSRT